MNLTRTIVTIACFLLFVTGVSASDAYDTALRLISEPAIGVTVSSAYGFSPGIQGSGSFRIGSGVDFPRDLGAEVYAGFSAVTRSRMTGVIILSGFSGFSCDIDLLWRAGTSWGLITGPRFSWMTLSDTDHGFFFPSASAGVYLAFPPGKDDSWHLRLTLRYTHHFRKDTTYSSSTSLGLSLIQDWSN